MDGVKIIISPNLELLHAACGVFENKLGFLLKENSVLKVTAANLMSRHCSHSVANIAQH